jgi:hypothetical protein
LEDLSIDLKPITVTKKLSELQPPLKIMSSEKWFFLLFICCIVGCQSYNRDANFTIINNSARLINYWVSCDSSFEHIQFRKENRLKVGDSIQPYLIYGPEGKGQSDTAWINAISQADDTALHVFCWYVDFSNHTDCFYQMCIKRYDFKLDALRAMKWRMVYP